MGRVPCQGKSIGEIIMVNIKTIAKEAGVSKSTVSRVINNEKYVSNETKEKVQRVMIENDYISNGNAVRLSTGSSNTIGIILPYNNSCYSQLIDNILIRANENNQQVLLLPTYYDKNAEKEYYKLINNKIVDSIISTTFMTNIKYLEKQLLRGKLFYRKNR